MLTAMVKSTTAGPTTIYTSSPLNPSISTFTSHRLWIREFNMVCLPLSFRVLGYLLRVGLLVLSSRQGASGIGLSPSINAL